MHRSLVLLLLLMFASGGNACQNLPPTQIIRNRVYHLHKYYICSGQVVESITLTKDIEPCKSACSSIECDAVNFYKHSETSYSCDIVTKWYGGMSDNSNAACYRATDAGTTTTQYIPPTTTPMTTTTTPTTTPPLPTTPDDCDD
ncbi:hypothetical protein Q1695_005388 [Nippostrongylus brasiliensis]|nr:hypothetical protein Q1695_005388 [Nippostrongylus brasiliensis]